MTLSNWLANSWLIEHKTTRREIRDLLAVVRRELADARVQGLSVDARFGHAYNAALQSAVAALAAAGFRVARGVSHHHYAIQSLAHTVGCEAKLVATLDKFRKKRNISDYERVGNVSEQEADEMLRLASTLSTAVRSWLQEEHPDLLEE
ncbi:MAG: hypothetical protein R6V05_05430 [Candidatus Brocadiia bacterium]